MSAVLGFDTSNYKTSVAVYEEGDAFLSDGRFLEVRPGERGLRQNDALFLHVKALPEVAKPMFERYGSFAAVGASYAPRRNEGSYMPCFLAGVTAGRMTADALHVPFFAFSHQEGHIASAVLTSGRRDLLNAGFLAWHLSGGTSELLLVGPHPEHIFDVSVIGGTKDLSAGQLIDRAGVLLGLSFPAGPALDRLSGEASLKMSMRPKPDGSFFSLSGAENKARELIEKNTSPGEVAYFVVRTVANAVAEATEKALLTHRLPVLCSGGVMANSLIRRELSGLGAIFAPAEFSGDNALGTAFLASLKLGGRISEQAT